MTKQHFEAIAECVALLPEADNRRYMAIMLADRFEGFNKHFDRDTFFKACGVDN